MEPFKDRNGRAIQPGDRLLWGSLRVGVALEYVRKGDWTWALMVEVEHGREAMPMTAEEVGVLDSQEVQP